MCCSAGLSRRYRGCRDTFVRERIFAPLGMAHSRYMLHTPVIPRRARGYERMSAGWEHAPRFSMTLPYAPGGLGSTLDDLIRCRRRTA